MNYKYANSLPTICTDGEIQRLWDSVDNPHEKPERQKLVRKVITRLQAAEDAVNQAYRCDPSNLRYYEDWLKVAGKPF